MFAETRPLAEEWTYRFLGAALAELGSHAAATGAAVDLLVPQAPLSQRRREPVPPPAGSPTADAAAVRLWAVTAGRPVAARGRLSVELIHVYLRDHPHESG